MSDGEPDPRSVRLTMVSVLIAIFMGALDQTIVATAMPALVRSLHSFNGYSGVISAYLIASTIALPIGGKLSDIYGRKRFLIGGTAWFVVASSLCGLAQSMTQLIVFRALKGLGTGVMQAAANTTIADLYPPVRRARSIALVSSTALLANVSGPLLGGYLTDGPGWRFIFFINVPIGIVGCVMAARFFPHVVQAQRRRPRIDYWGALGLVASVVPVLWALHVVGETQRWHEPLVTALFALGALCGVGFLLIERRAEQPVVPLVVFGNPIIAISLVTSGLTMAAMTGITVFVPLFLQGVLHVSASASGKVLLPLSVTFAVTATATGLTVARLDRYKALAVAGAAIATLGCFMLTRMDGATSKSVLIRNMVTAGFGLAACMPIYNLAVQNAARLELLGITTAMVYFVRSISASVAVAVYGTILAARTQSHGLPDAVHGIFVTVLALVATSFLATLFLREQPLRRSNVPRPTAASD